ncbi:hypothetical protein MLD38_033971 [Melastoma candidum]|uniref:Uncharacterized protein n=1 Tax=Melastoma candidum TaxID=119954 RepID=A0ACB9MAR9_9MYRT|nr:hypothetical protein MLD38_033971 [Melastoma candidum]
MVMKVSSSMPSDLSPPKSASDPDEKEISDDEDDDRNHKHRRREMRSESSEQDSMEPTITRPFRKHNRPFQNGYPVKDNESRANQSWKNFDSSDRDFNKFERRQLGSTSFSRPTRLNQSFIGNMGPGRGRGRDNGAWNHRDLRLNSVDLASQMIQRGPATPGLFPGMGLPGVPGVQNGSWGTFGLLPGAAGCMEALPPVGLQGTFVPPIASSVNMGIPRQRCRDFEERGFCLRGDMCPMEHGVNRIVVEDVQSLSQFNLPVSLPSAPILGTPPMPGALASVSSSSAMLMNNKGPHGKSGRAIVPDAAVNSSYTASGNLGASDLYDPDQLLWSNGGPEEPPSLSLHSHHPNDPTLFDHDNVGLPTRKAPDMGHQDGGIKLPVAPQGTSLSVWGKIRRGKNDPKGEFGSNVSTSGFSGNENGVTSAGGTRSSYRGKQIIANASEQKSIIVSNQGQSDASNTPRKPTQKALRTLFVNGVPLKNNKRETLFAHFKKFGKVIDIHIPSNSERAFVQFSKREEAESALMAPDAVMGNRFIKLWWANRDNIVDEEMGNIPSNPKLVTAISIPGNISSAGRGKDIYSAPSKAGEAAELGTHLQASDQSKPSTTSGPKVTPANQKKLESLELLKEELRKKQEMLDRKRDEFKRQLVKLERQTTVKGDVISEPSNKRLKVGLATDAADVSTPRSSSDEAAAVSVKHLSTSDDVASSQNDVTNGINNSAVSVDPPSASASLLAEESSPIKEPTRASLDFIPISLDNEQDGDSCPISFKILPPLPTGLANVAALEEHFSAYGELTLMKLEDMDGQGDGDEAQTAKSLFALIGFRTQASADRAFNDGKCWQGQTMNFRWSADSGNVAPHSNEESPSSASPMDLNGTQPVAESREKS